MKKTILVVEDERPLLAAIQLSLENKGIGVVTARTIDQALSYIEDLEPIHAIWLDHYLLGKKDGLDLVAAVKNHPEWKYIPIFIVSNTASSDKVQSYLQLGVEKFYVKSEKKLSEIIQEIMEVINDPE